MPAHITETPPQPQFPLREFDQVIEALLEFRNAFDEHGEPLEDDDPPEPVGDETDTSWVEWDCMAPSSKRGPNIAGQNEDDEEDNEDRGFDEDDPDFRPLPKLIRRHLGPGCAISDNDKGAEDENERDEGECGHAVRYGVDQSRPIGPDNPEAA